MINEKEVSFSMKNDSYTKSISMNILFSAEKKYLTKPATYCTKLTGYLAALLRKRSL